MGMKNSPVKWGGGYSYATNGRKWQINSAMFLIIVLDICYIGWKMEVQF